MKELSIEEKAKRYDEALARANEMIKDMTNMGGVAKVDDIQYIFPELKESEDERIRNTIFDCLYKCSDSGVITREQRKRCIAWLEKQRKNDMGISEATKQKLEDNLNKALEKETPESWNEFLEKQGEQKPADKVEPKFHEGEWIIHHGTENIYQVVAIIDNQYQLKYGDNYTIQNCVDVDRCARLWDITKDAKAGDVLACPNDAGDRDVVFIFKNINSDEGWVFCFCASDANGCFCTNNDYVGNSNSTNISPATKEQRDALMKKMADAGWEFDFDKKELKKIEQKSAEWHREDEQNLNACLGFIPDAYLCRWLKDVIHVKYDKPAWSEEDEAIYYGVIETEQYMLDVVNGIKKFNVGNISIKEECTRELNWLKSLRPQNRWKPSDEQINALDFFIDCVVPDEFNYKKQTLKDLLEQLKKLREE